MRTSSAASKTGLGYRERDVRFDDGGTPLSAENGACWVCGRSCLEHESHACRSCRRGKPEDWVAPARPVVAAPLRTLEEHEREKLGWRELNKISFEKKKTEEKTMAVTNVGCLVAGCEAKTCGRRLCSTHYSRAHRLVDLKEGAWEDFATPEGATAGLSNPVGPRIVRQAPKKAIPDTVTLPSSACAASVAPKASVREVIAAAVPETPVTAPAGTVKLGGFFAGAPEEPGTSRWPLVLPASASEREQLADFLADVAVRAIRRLVLA